jgi:Xaa-Pro aminopeptidase
MNLSRLCVFSVALALGAAPALTAADIWKIAPPPPTSWQRDRVADLVRHRTAVMERIGANGVVILYAAEPRNYAGDVDWPYRQENDFYYLTGIAQAGCYLVLIPGGAAIHQILFLPPSNPAQEDWTGHILTPAEAREISGIQDIWDARRFPEFLSALLPRAKSAIAEALSEPTSAAGSRRAPPASPEPIPVDVAQAFAAPMRHPELYLITRGQPLEYRRERDLATRLSAADTALRIQDPTSIFNRLRMVKSRRELDLLEQAAAITAEAFQRAFALAVPGTREYEIQAQFEFTFLRRGGHWGYPCIVGSGKNTTTLHYEANRDTMSSGDLLLMDSAAEFDGYSADVTRTIPVNGKFTEEQAEIYRLVWAAHEAALAEAKPGHVAADDDNAMNAAAVKVFQQGLLRLGLITDAKSRQYAVWFNHGIGHNIGLNVHDAMEGRELVPGMVITIEPGLYIRPDALDDLPKTPENAKFIAAVRPAFEKYKGIGVRIEDDVLITQGEPRVITSAIPERVEDVEAEIARLRTALRTTPLP